MHALLKLAFLVSVTFSNPGGSAMGPAYTQPEAHGRIEQITPNKVLITTASGITATVETTAEIPLPTEYREGDVSFLYRSNVNQTVRVTLGQGMTFAVDGKYFESHQLKMGNSKGVVVTASRPGNYVFQGKAFSLAVGPITDTNDKAGYVVQYLHRGRNTHVYWIPSEEIAGSK